MRIDLMKNDGGDLLGVTVRLSRRNIESLLHMLDHRDKAVPALSSRDKHVEILVMPQENDEHYADGFPAGRMSWEKAADAVPSV